MAKTSEELSVAVEVVRARCSLQDAINPHAPDALCDSDLIDLADFLLIVQENCGNSETPVEHAIVEMANDYRYKRDRGIGLTPDDLIRVVEHTDGCRMWFNEAIDIARRFRKQYGKLLDEADAKEVA